MKITNGPMTDFLNERDLTNLNAYFNALYPGVDVSVSVNLNRTNDADDAVLASPSNAKAPEHCLRYVLSYKHPLAPSKSVYVAQEQHEKPFDLHQGIKDVLSMYEKQMNCDHGFVRPKDQFGNAFPDGRAICPHCDLAVPDNLPPISGVSVISMSLSEDVVAQYPWGNAYIQGGSSGFVFSEKQSYTTAFVEAFPSIHGFGTFIRGEGKDVQAAEKACWDAYQRKMTCKEHEWSREVHGVYRKDGYARCVHCNLCTREALPPETLCQVCQVPTDKTYNDGFICLTHYYEKEESERIAAHMDQLLGYRGAESNGLKEMFDYQFVTRLQSALFKQLGESRYLVVKSQFRSTIAFIKHNFYVKMLNLHPLKSIEHLSDDAYDKMDECHAFTLKNIDKIIANIDAMIEFRANESADSSKIEPVTIRDVIPEKYLL